jgi:hypothetical protein
VANASTAEGEFKVSVKKSLLGEKEDSSFGNRRTVAQQLLDHDVARAQ